MTHIGGNHMVQDNAQIAEIRENRTSKYDLKLTKSFRPTSAILRATASKSSMAPVTRFTVARSSAPLESVAYPMGESLSAMIIVIIFETLLNRRCLLGGRLWHSLS